MPELFKDSRAFKSVMARSENELLLSCARTNVCEDEAARIKRLASLALDWDYLLRLAHRHTVLPLLYRNLSDHARDAVPQTHRKRLQKSFRDNATRNLLLSGELVRIVRLFESEGVPVLAYKGPALAITAYGDLSLRRFIDLDIIVNTRDVSRAGEMLRSLGFGQSGGLSRSQEKILLRSQHNLAYKRDGGKLIVELHWRLASSRFAEVPLEERVWERAETVNLCGGEVRCLSPEDLLFALCVHGTKHLWERLSWVCDVAEMLSAYPRLDFDYALQIASESHTERMLFLGLRLASGLLGATLPAKFVAQIEADPATDRLTASVAERLFESVEYESVSFLGNVSFNLRARRRLREKLRYFRFILTPTDGDLTALPLPAGLSFFYYLLRPFRLILKGSTDR
jgi:hypothetical protein